MNSASSPPLEIGVRPDLAARVGHSRASFHHIRRFEWDLAGGQALMPGWLAHCGLFPRLFWRTRSGTSQTLAVGEIASGTLASLQPMLEDADEGVRIFGGGRFDAGGRVDATWRGFDAEHFFIPQAEIIQSGRRTRLAVNLGPHADGLREIEAWIARLGEESRESAPRVLTRWDQPNFLQWKEAVDAALAAFQDSPLRKVVLARRSRLELAEPVPPHGLLEILMASAPACFHFLLELSPRSGAFLGASPELLFRRFGADLDSEAVAGTRPRSMDAVEDERLESQLRVFSKEQLEHRLVVDSLAGTFDALCETHQHDAQPGVLKLSRVQHLRTALTGVLKKGVTDAEILAAFHPTPATCGCPSALARQFLETHESFDRGWYAGPIGCVSRETAEFAVAIRSLLVRGPRLDVFAGAGIVAGSDPEREWSELEDKISGVLNPLSP